jgi:thymidine kinase
MNAGKSKRLIEEIDKNYFTAHFPFLIIKPSIDTRDGAFIKSRAIDTKYPALMIDEGNQQLLELLFAGVDKFKYIFIDEVQFFSKDFIVRLVANCPEKKVRLVASGLLYDFKGELFPSTRYLVENVTASNFIYLDGECQECGSTINNNTVLVDSKTGRVIKSGNTTKPEGSDNTTEYKVLCHKCLRDR